MADEITLVTWSSQTVTPLDDGIIYDKFMANSGIISGGEVTISDSSTLHINAGHGIICGRKFTIVDSDIAVELSSSDTLYGRLYIHLDLSSVSTPIELLTETGASLTDESQDTSANINSGVWDMNIATFTVDTSTLDNLVSVAPTVQNVNNTVATIEDTTLAQNSYSVGEYLVHRGVLMKVTAAITAGDTLEEGTNISSTTVGAELNSVGLTTTDDFTISSGVTSYTISDASITATNDVLIMFDTSSLSTIEDASLDSTATVQAAGSITLTFENALAASVTGHCVILN